MELLRNSRPALAFAGHLHEVGAHRKRVREKLAELLCYDGDARPAEIQWQSIARKRCEYGTIEKVVYRSCGHCDVPAFLCLPDHPAADTIFLCLQGHSASGIHLSIASDPEDWNRPLEAAGDRDFALGCMKRGIAALCIEQSAFGERLERKQEKKAPTFCHDAFLHALMLGKTLMGERVYDVARGIDFLKSRADCRFSKIGIMGNSGGGTVAVYSAALIPEIDFCMPSCAFGSFAESKMRVYHCACGYVPRMLEYLEMDDVLAVFAPRPVVIVAGLNDPIVPYESVTTAYDRLKKVYAALRAEEHCRLVAGNDGHRFYADDAWKCMLPEVLNV